MLCVGDIRRGMASITPQRLGGQQSSEAAVLVGIVERDKRPHFLLTRRTQEVATHKGQISFPGGVREPDDRSSSQTALRETYEEIGVDPSLVEVFGEFHEYLAVTDHRVRCFVGLVSAAANYQPQSTEVAYVLEVPFDFFLETKPRVEIRSRRGNRQEEVYFYDFDGETIWGLTARIIKDFLECIHS